MRILFNHGLTAGELFTNTPSKITERKWRWLNDTYGWHRTYEDALADPFKYCFSLMLNKVIDDKVRFKLPVSSDAYIDFEIVKDDKFMEQRQNGRFQEIDFIESDFTGYFINYYFKSKAYYKKVPIYLGGDLKQKFLGGINSGIKYYTTKDITIDEFIDTVYERFNQHTKAEIKRIITHGFRRMHSAIRYGCTLSMMSNRYSCKAHVGSLTLIPDKQIKNYSIRRDRKFRRIEMWKKNEFDGFYYIGLNSTKFLEWLEWNKTSKTVCKFYNVVPRKLQEELYYKAKHIYVFKYKSKKFRGWAFWEDKLELRKLEFLGESIDGKFTPVTKT